MGKREKPPTGACAEDISAVWFNSFPSLVRFRSWRGYARPFVVLPTGPAPGPGTSRESRVARGEVVVVRLPRHDRRSERRDCHGKSRRRRRQQQQQQRATFVTVDEERNRQGGTRFDMGTNSLFNRPARPDRHTRREPAPSAAKSLNRALAGQAAGGIASQTATPLRRRHPCSCEEVLMRSGSEARVCVDERGEGPCALVQHPIW